MDSISPSILLFCSSFTLTVSSLVPTEQPDCPYKKKVGDFYREHGLPKKKNDYDDSEDSEDSEDSDDSDEPTGGNWICERKFKDRLKMCTGIYRLMVNRRFDTKYEIPDERDRMHVNTECEKLNMTFYAPVNKGNSTRRERLTLQVDMFKCPVSKMDIKFKFSWKIFRPKRYDFYVTTGYGDDGVTLLNDSPNKENICVINMFRPKSKS